MDSEHFEFHVMAVGVFILMFFSLFLVFVLFIIEDKEPEEGEEPLEQGCFIDAIVRFCFKKLKPKKSRRNGYSSI